MRVKLKEDIRIKELSKNFWYGCRSDTMKFIDLFYNSNYEQDVIVATKEPDGSYKIITNDGEYVVTPNAFEIIEEDKEIEEIEFDEIDEMTDYDIYSYPECEDDSKANFKNKINELIRNQKKIIKAVNELKKGK